MEIVLCYLFVVMFFWVRVRVKVRVENGRLLFKGNPMSCLFYYRICTTGAFRVAKEC